MVNGTANDGLAMLRERVTWSNETLDEGLARIGPAKHKGKHVWSAGAKEARCARGPLDKV